MKRTSQLTAFGLLAVLGGGAFGMALLGSGDYDMDWFTIDSGGGVATGDDLTLHGSIGQWDAGIPLTGGDFTLTGGFWAADAPPVVSEPAELVDFAIPWGTLISGDLESLKFDDTIRMRIASKYGFVASEPNLLRLQVFAETTVLGGSAFDLRIKSRLNNPGGTVRVRLKNWSNNLFQDVHTYPLGLTEIIEVVEGVDATNRIRQTDGRIELEAHHVILATFSPTGFEGLFDWFEIRVR